MTPLGHDDHNTLPDRVRSGEARRIHLIAICGVAMAALAGMLKERGYQVSGSDENVYPPMSTLLERLGIPIRHGFCAENVADRPDLVVVGNKVSRDNPEVQAMLSMGLPYLSLPQVLAQLFLPARRSLVVAGTHGKTTSTALLAFVLETAGRDPSVMVGGHALDFGGNYKLGKGEDFIVEGDEYDTAFFDKGPKFLHYRPDALLLTAVEFDHADVYRDIDHVKQSFRQLVEMLPTSAPLAVASDFPHAVDIATARAAVTFGLQPQAQWRAVNVRDDGRYTLFDITYQGRHDCSARIGLIGAINARNALGVFVLARALGLERGQILAALTGFRGVARRQEVVGEWNGVTLIDDFAHHPTAVRGVIEAVRLRYPDRRLWAVFEPRSNTSRRKVFQSQYAAALGTADRVIVSTVFQKESDAVSTTDLFSPAQLVADLRASGRLADNPGGAEEIAGFLAREARSGDVILLMSNGGFGGLRDKLAGVFSPA